MIYDCGCCKLNYIEIQMFMIEAEVRVSKSYFLKWIIFIYMNYIILFWTEFINLLIYNCRNQIVVIFVYFVSTCRLFWFYIVTTKSFFWTQAHYILFNINQEKHSPDLPFKYYLFDNRSLIVSATKKRKDIKMLFCLSVPVQKSLI